MNQTITEQARSMRLHSWRLKLFWAEAINIIVHLINRRPSLPLHEGLPEEAWNGKKVNLSYLRVFGKASYVHIDAGSRSKLDSKSIKSFSLDMAPDEFEYKFWDYQNNKIIRSRDATFNKNEMDKDKKGASTTPEYSSIFVELKEESAYKENVGHPTVNEERWRLAYCDQEIDEEYIFVEVFSIPLLLVSHRWWRTKMLLKSIVSGEFKRVGADHERRNEVSCAESSMGFYKISQGAKGPPQQMDLQNKRRK